MNKEEKISYLKEMIELLNKLLEVLDTMNDFFNMVLEFIFIRYPAMFILPVLVVFTFFFCLSGSS